MIGSKIREYEEKLEAAKDFDDLYAALADTPYGRLLDAFKTGKLKFGVRVLLPLLHDYVAGQTEQIIKKDYPEKEQEALLDIIRMRADMTTIEGLYRLKKYFPQRIYRTTIPRNVRLSEAPSFGQPAAYYDKASRGAAAYDQLAEEFLQRNYK